MAGIDLAHDPVRVHPGDGVVARFGAAALAVMPVAPEQTAGLYDLLQLVQKVARDDPSPGRRLARRVAVLLGDREPDSMPSFCLVSQDGDGLAIMVHGDADAVLSRPGSQERLSGRGVATWLDRVIYPPVDFLVLGTASGPPGLPDAAFDLEAGIVPGCGVTIVPKSSPTAGAGGEGSSPYDGPEPVGDETRFAAAPASLPEPAEPVPFISVPLIGVVLEDVREPLPVAGGDIPAVPAAAKEREAPLVPGVYCSEGHLNEPSGRFCVWCGRSLVHVTPLVVQGPRPPLGVMVLDNGDTYIADGDYIIGRDPGQNADVIAGLARPLRLEDPARTVSRVHARIQLDGWSVKVIDLRSVNQTFVLAPGATSWIALIPEQPTTIEPGSRVRLGPSGARYFDFGSPHHHG